MLTASTLAPFAIAGSEEFIALAILLAFLVGVIQVSLGAFRLGALVNLVSHPVIVGFMNAAAIIIGLSQLNKLLGVPLTRSDYFLNDIWDVVRQAADTHFPTLLMKPRAVILGRMPDGTLSDMKAHGLSPISPHFIALRYDGSLDFLSAAHFEEVILQAHAEFPEAKTILVIGNGINSMDASGTEKIREIAKYLHEANVTLALSSLKKPVRDSFDRAGLTAVLHEENMFISRERAFQALGVKPAES